MTQDRTSDFDVFLSYSRAADGELSEALQRGLARLAKRWNQPRALKVFRDRESLAAAPDLTAAIRAGLESSRYFVLLASPQAAASVWVGHEIDYWKRHRTPETFMIALTDGEIAWSGGDFDWEKTTALPLSLRSYFPAEPIWEDFRSIRAEDDRTLRNSEFRSAVASLAAQPRGIPKDQLDSAEVRSHRITVAVRRALITGLVVALVVAVALGTGFLFQRNDARHQRDVASARLASVRADNLIDSDVRSALLLAVAGYQMNPSPEAYSTLLRANLTSPHLRGYLKAGSPITAIETSGDGRTVLAALADGRVMRWSEGEQALTALDQLNGAAGSVATNNDGSVIMGAGTSGIRLWRKDGGAATIDVGSGSGAKVSVSPSGRSAIVSVAAGWNKMSFSLIDVASGSVRSRFDKPEDNTPGWDKVLLTSDEEVFVMDTGRGHGQRLRVQDWSAIADFTFAYGLHERGSEPTGQVSFTSASNGNPTIPVWRTDTGRTGGPDALTAEVPALYRASPIVLSEDGSTAAVAQDDTIYIAPVVRGDERRPAPIKLTGAGTVDNSGMLRFLGSSTRSLVSAFDDLIAVWSLDQIDRLAQSRSLPISARCTACRAPTVTISPQADTAALPAEQIEKDNKQFQGLILQPLDDAGRSREIIKGLSGEPVWTSDKDLLVFSTQDPKQWPRLPEGLKIVQVPEGVMAARLRPGAGTVIVVDGNGAPRSYDLKSGRLGPAPSGVSLPDKTTVWSATIDSEGATVAVHYGYADVVVREAESGRQLATIKGPEIGSVLYAGTRLIVQRSDGSIETWTRDGTALESSAPSDLGYSRISSAADVDADNSGSLIARVKLDGSVVLSAGPTGATIAVIPTINPNDNGKTGVGLSADGHLLVTATEGGFGNPLDGKLVVRDLAADALIRLACETAGPDLADAEWQRLVGIPRPPASRCP